MSSLSVVKLSLNIDESKKWLQSFLDLKSLNDLACIDDIEFVETDNSFTSIFDNSGSNLFFGLDIETWISSIQDEILYYAQYDEDEGNVEYVHIEKEEVIRDYRMYDFSVSVDEGSNPYFDDFAEALSFIDENFME